MKRMLLLGLLLIFPLVSAFDLPEYSTTVYNFLFNGTTLDNTSTYNWTKYNGTVATDIYIENHDGTPGGALYFDETLNYYNLTGQSPTLPGVQENFTFEFIVKCNATEDLDPPGTLGRTIWSNDDGDVFGHAQVYSTYTDNRPAIRDNLNNFWNPGTISGAIIVNSSYSYHAYTRNCTGVICDIIYYYNGSAIAWDNNTIVDSGFTIVGDDFRLGIESAGDEHPTNCSISQLHYFLESLSPEMAEERYNLSFNLSSPPVGGNATNCTPYAVNLLSVAAGGSNNSGELFTEDIELTGDAEFLFHFDNVSASLIEDVTGNHNMTLINGTTANITDHVGNTTQAVSFNHSGYGYFNLTGNISISNQEDFTVHIIYECADDSTPNAKPVYQADNPGVLTLVYDDTGADYEIALRIRDDTAGDSYKFYDAADDLNQSWTYFISQRNCSGGSCDITHYMNGSAVIWDNSTAADGAITLYEQNFHIGSNDEAAGWPATGCAISEFMLEIGIGTTPDKAGGFWYNVTVNETPASSNNTYAVVNDTNVYYQFDLQNTTTFYPIVGDNDTYGLTYVSAESQIPPSSPGKLRKSVYFDGEDRIKTLNDHNFNGGTVGNQSYAVSLWAKFLENTEQILIAHGSPPSHTNSSFHLAVEADDDIVWLTSYSTNDSYSLTGTPSATPFDGEWHNIIISQQYLGCNLTNKVIFYDGQLLTNTTVNDTYNANNSFTTTLGGRSEDDATQSGSFLNGYIDEVSFWWGNQTEINYSEASAIYNNNTGRELTTNATIINNITIDYRNGTDNTSLPHYNVTILFDSDNETFSFDLNETNLTFGVLSTEFNLTGTINNATNFVATTRNYNETSVEGGLYDLLFYDSFLANILINDTRTGGNITDNVSVKFINEDRNYENWTTNSSLFQYVIGDIYDILVENLDDANYAIAQYDNQNVTVNSTVSGTLPTYTLTAYLFNQSPSGSMNITATVYDSAAIPIEGAELHVQKYDFTTNSYLTQEILLTNFEGITNFYGTLDNDEYKFLIFVNNNLVLSTNPTQLFSTEMTFFVNTGADLGEKWFTAQDLTYNLEYDNLTQNATLTWFGLASPITEICLRVYDDPGRDLQNATCQTAASGTIVINVVNTTAPSTLSIEAIAKVEGSPPTEILLQGKSIFLELANLVGELGLFLTIILILITIGISWWQPSLIPVTSTGALFLAGFLGLHTLPTTLTFTLLVIGFGLTVYISDKA